MYQLKVFKGCAVPGEKQKDSVSNVQRVVPGPASRSPVNYKRITLRIIISLFQLARVHERCHRRVLTFRRRKKQVFRFEETPLIHGQKDRRTETKWALGI
jgi:hypothetical protein